MNSTEKINRFLEVDSALKRPFNKTSIFKRQC